MSGIDKGWFNGFFSACGWLDTINESRPVPKICFRTRHREAMYYLVQNYPIDHGPIVIELHGRHWFIEITKPATVIEMLESLKEDPLNKKISEVGLYLYKQVSLYKTEPAAILKARRVTEILDKEVKEIEFPL